MTDTIRILIVEDLPSDEELVKREIRKAGIDFISVRVETREAFLSSLHGFKPDIVLADYALPSFDGMTALRLTRECEPLLPFIIVTGSINEETAVECMKAGASDYVIKGHAGGIGSAIRGALEMKRLAVEREKAYALLSENEERYRTLFETMAQGVVYFDADGVAKSANPAAERILGVPLDRIQGLPCMRLFEKIKNENGGEISEKELPVTVVLNTSKPVGSRIMGVYNRMDESYRWVRVTAVPLGGSNGGLHGQVYMTMEDITEIKTGQDMLRRSLQEKEVLIREIHHRVKNNMQIISSLLNLQGGYNRNPELKGIIISMQNRIKSMAIIHEELYRSDDFSDINFGACVRNLANELLFSFVEDPSRITIRLNVADIRLSIDASLPCSLIVNELISNALKYAFPGGRRGEIFVSMRKEENGACTLVIEDDGVGIPEGIDIEKTGTMGLFLVRLLVKQMGGAITLYREKGTKFVLRCQERTRV
jgi:PAS domain S-box-containing protein